MPEPSNKSKPEIEASYYDKYGVEIKNFDILKVFHFTGVNNQGRGRKHYYVYKWVMLVESNGKLYWAALHLDSDKLNRHYWLKGGYGVKPSHWQPIVLPLPPGAIFQRERSSNG